MAKNLNEEEVLLDEKEYEDQEESIFMETNSNDIESLLETLSLGLMKDNMYAQIRYETTSITDFLSTVIEKFKYILGLDEIATEDKMELKESMSDFCIDIVDEICKMNNLDANIDPSLQFEQTMEVTKTLYNFFVLHRYSNVEGFLKGFIDRHKDTLIELMDIGDRGKDITYNSNKRKQMSHENNCILSNIFSVINYIRDEMEIDQNEFIDIVDNGDYWADQLRDYFSNGTLYGDFVHKLLYNVLSDDYDNGEVQRIRNAVRIHFYTNNNQNDSIDTEE